MLIAQHPDTGETLFSGDPGDYPLGGIIVETRMQMPDGTEVVARRQASTRLAPDDSTPDAE